MIFNFRTNNRQILTTKMVRETLELPLLLEIITILGEREEVLKDNIDYLQIFKINGNRIRCEQEQPECSIEKILLVESEPIEVFAIMEESLESNEKYWVILFSNEY